MKLNANDYEASEVIRFIRENAGLIQEEFGHKIDRKRRSVQCYEYGELNFDFKFLLEIAQTFGLKIIIKDKYNKFNIVATNYQANEILKIIREYTKLSIKEFAKLINRSRSAAQNYEYGYRNYDFKQLQSITKKLNLDIIIEDKNKGY